MSHPVRSNPTAPATVVPDRATRRRLGLEIVLVLMLTFGLSGLRAIIHLAEALANPAPLGEQTQELNSAQSSLPIFDILLQATSIISLLAYGLLAVYLLSLTGNRLPRTRLPRTRLPRIRLSDVGWGAALAAIIGIPGLALYVTAVHMGWSKQIIPAPLASWWVIVPLLGWAAANAFAEEVVVVFYLSVRLQQVGWKWWWTLIATSALRASYHLYQGVSAGFGNFAMGLLFGGIYLRTGRVWPLVVAHFLIDAVAFVGYRVLGGDLSFLGL